MLATREGWPLMVSKTAVAVRHVHFEDLGAFRAPIEAAGYEVRYVDAFEWPLRTLELVRADLLVVLGGPIGAGQDHAYPFLAEETDVVAQRLKAGRPTMSICLGAQLIARAAGARVRPGEAKEIGFAPIELTEAGRASCLAPYAGDPTALHWHGDTFDLPAGAVRLALTGLCENQAFSMGPNVVGFQFHPEASAAGFERWLVGHAVELAAAGVDVAALRAEARWHGLQLERKAHSVISVWLDGLKVCGDDHGYASRRVPRGGDRGGHRAKPRRGARTHHRCLRPFRSRPRQGSAAARLEDRRGTARQDGL